VTIPDKEEIGYKPEALINDLNLPEVKTIKGDGKFIKRDNNYFFGYKILLDINHFDTTKVPKKYLQDTEIEINKHKITAVGIKEVTYEITLEFTLLDKDNFELSKIISNTETIQSGQKNEIQDFIRNAIPLKTIELTKHIKLFVSVDKCVSCNDTN
jgi:hypothetical protein